MSETVGVRELRQNLSKYLQRVKAGEGVARLVPAGSDSYVELATRVCASVPLESLERIVERIRLVEHPAGTTDAYLEETRADRLP